MRLPVRSSLQPILLSGLRFLRPGIAVRRLVGLGLLLSPLLAAGWLTTLPHAVLARDKPDGADGQMRREQGATAGNPYLGSAGCLQCHAEYRSALSTAMGQAAFASAQLPTLPGLSGAGPLTLLTGEYQVSLEPNAPEGPRMVARMGANTLSAPVRWAFGQGRFGQTYVLEYNGHFLESRASYFKTLGGLDLTIGHNPRPPASLLAALGRPLPPEEVQSCFRCHTSENVSAGQLDPAKSHPGITCENCHGAGTTHAQLMKTGKAVSSDRSAIFDPESLPPAEINDFCGSCHRTTREVVRSGVHDVRTVRFQPYRLENSRCYDPSDARITCVACHNPHRDLETSTQSYDSKCLRCHAGGPTPIGTATAPRCPRATSNCVSCHMPRIDLPGAHNAFTDHYIRIVDAKAPYPG